VLTNNNENASFRYEREIRNKRVQTAKGFSSADIPTVIPLFFFSSRKDSHEAQDKDEESNLHITRRTFARQKKTCLRKRRSQPTTNFPKDENASKAQAKKG
jgi:hypothetical protein